jgi:alkaline phosphatase D
MNTTRRLFLEKSGAAAVYSLLGIGSQTMSDSSQQARAPQPEKHQYKKQNRDQIAHVSDGEYARAIDHFHQYLEQYPVDLESFYGLALAYSQQGDLTRAFNYLQRAVDHGMPFERFVAGPRDLFRPLSETAKFRHLVDRYTGELIHGPLLGALTDTNARFWVRTRSEVPVEVYVRRPGKQLIHTSQVVESERANDYTAVARVEELQPDTDYLYTLRLDGREVPGEWSFRTFPPTGQPARFEVGFGGCAGYTPWNEHIWRTIASYDFPAFFITGDNVYIDHPEYPTVQQYCYYRRQSRPEFRALTGSTSIFAIWDDHDFGDNDSWGGPDVSDPSWKKPVWETFRNNWNNPYYGGGEEQPGCWFTTSIADVDFFMIDDRYYRTDPEVDRPSILGPAQKRWLFDQLRGSEATFKFVVSSVPWADGTKPGSLDTWEGYRQERKEIFSFLHEHRIDGVILLSGDRHRSDVWKIERDAGYDLYEFESGRLTNFHRHDEMPGALFSYNKKCSFGRLIVDTTPSDAWVTYEIINIDSESVYSMTVQESDISY